MYDSIYALYEYYLFFLIIRKNEECYINIYLAIIKQL